METWLITLIACFVVYEIFEHLIFPLFWLIRCGWRKSAYGTSGMIGKKCVVIQWNGSFGKIRIGGELWNATSHSPLMSGSEAVILEIQGLTLLVSPSDVLTGKLK